MLNKLIMLLFGFVIVINSQTGYYKSFNFQKAYEYKTRSLNGKPGVNYWQNFSNYKIKATVNVDSSIINGTEIVEYFNESPDSLDKIVIRLYQNILKKGKARDWSLNPNGESDGVLISSFKVDGEDFDMTRVSYTATNMIVPLIEKLLPGSSVKLEIEWLVKIPIINAIRMGNYGSGEMFIAYWYPQIAVYDDIDGWDMNEYYGIVEFYNDHNNYDVEITIPPKHLLWSTGIVTNMNEIFSEEIISRFNKAKTSNEVVRIVTKEDHINGNIFQNDENITYKIEAEKITDFSFAISDSYNWDGVAAIVDSAKGEKTLAQAAYEEGSIHYNNAAIYSKETIEYMSHILPGYPYPYPEMTSFANKNSSGGMETPMMANNGVPLELYSHVGLIFHEIAHNYFPFMMGTNERKYAWMDEGWAAFYPRELVEKFSPDFDYWANRVSSYETSAGLEGEIPLMIPSYSVKGSEVRTNFYNRPSVAYNELMELLGREKFKAAMLDYINNWVGKHPIPYDFFYSMNNSVGEDLGWFWKPWFFEFGYPDLGIKHVALDENIYNVTVKKIGNIPTRIYIKAYSEDGSFVEAFESAEVWKSGNTETSIRISSEKELVRFELGNSHIPDAFRKNNVFEGFLK